MLTLQPTLTAVHLADQKQVGSLRISLEEFAHVSPLRVIDYRLRRWHCKQKTEARERQRYQQPEKNYEDDEIILTISRR